MQMNGIGYVRLNAGIYTRSSSGIDNQHSYLVLLRELEIVICLQALNVICQLRDGNRRMTCHACQARKWRQKPFQYMEEPIIWCKDFQQKCC